jgi:hypothetical protein
VCQQIKATQDINIASHVDRQTQLAEVISQLDLLGRSHSGTAIGTPSVPPQSISVVRTNSIFVKDFSPNTETFSDEKIGFNFLVSIAQGSMG